MPLTWTRKLGFSLLLQPIGAQQLGVFSIHPIESGQLAGFLDRIPGRFRYVDICLNRENPEVPVHWRSMERDNYELDLSAPEDRYHDNTRRNLQKGLSWKFECRDISVRDYLYLKFHGQKDVRPAVRWSYLERLYEGLLSLKKAALFGLFLENDLQAAAVLGYARSRTIYLNGCNSDEGKENRAMFVLMDKLISRSRSTSGIFDFEGSNVPGVARFYEGFGGVRSVYREIVRTGFPFLWKIK
jgi:hypothetical protein